MSIGPTHPGVSLQELPGGIHTITGVSTSVAMFIGRATKGPADDPSRCLSYSDFVQLFSTDISLSDLAPQVEQFFLNGGSECYVLRIVSGSSTGAGPTADGQVTDDQPPGLTDYRAAFQLIDEKVDIFNLMILAKDNSNGKGPANPPTDLASIWGAASEFCQKRRALLLVDPPDIPDGIGTWTPAGATAGQIAQNATDPAKGVNALRQGLVAENCALYFPRVIISREDGKYSLAPSGTIAGVMARIDAKRGVWKAAAGEEATLVGVEGPEVRFTDTQTGILNPAAVNTLRVLPQGTVSWGARTLAGDDRFQSEWKYIPVRRTAMFIGESLYRGTKWVEFEPNAEPLWAQIRLSIGAFMRSLFVLGAFQGSRTSDAYFVKCDSSTTTQNDVSAGVVNIIVGFAPLKPAEFVILTIHQLAGQNQP